MVQTSATAAREMVPRFSQRAWSADLELCVGQFNEHPGFCRYPARICGQSVVKTNFEMIFVGRENYP